MRERAMLTLLVVAGCTGLNPAYGSAVSHTGAATEATPSTEGETRDAGPGSDGTESAAGGSDAEASSDATADESAGGLGTGVDTSDSDRIVVLFVTGHVGGDFAASAASAFVAASDICLEARSSPPAATVCDPNAIVRPIIRASPWSPLSVQAYPVEWHGAPVYGPTGDQLALSMVDLLDEDQPLLTTLSAAGAHPAKGSAFWSGGFTGTVADSCGDWKLADGLALVGSFGDQVGWFDAGEQSCDSTYHLLCACQALGNWP